jgi:signal transduction histidine kinase
MANTTISKSNKIPFRVSARTAKLIGLENFSSEEGAVIELVKNTYDADSKNCILIFDIHYNKIFDKGTDTVLDEIDRSKSSIFIIDNGVGMTNNIIVNQWMTIGTDNKLYEHTTSDGRVKTGAKGIGRFALNRLGMLTNMYTVSKDDKSGNEWLVNWNDFDVQGATVSDVEAVITVLDNPNINNKIEQLFSNHERITSLINNSNFDSGTIIQITELNDNWDFEKLNKLFGNLEMLLPPSEQSDFSIDFFSLNHIDEFGTVKRAYYDDFDYKVSADFNQNNDGKIKLQITRNELDIDSLENRYIKVYDFEPMKKEPYRLQDFKAKKVIIEKSIENLFSKDVDRNLLERLGKFNFTFYFLKNTISDDKEDGDLKKFPYNSFSSANRKAWLKKFGGVKIFRDDFRIRPYGENGDDWLKLGERQSQSPGGVAQRLGGYRIRPNQIAGTIKISRLHNLDFIDKSGREGIIENDAFDLFKNVLKEIISLFEKDRNTIMYHLSELYKQNNKEAEKLRMAQLAAAEINSDNDIEEEEEEENENNGDNVSNNAGQNEKSDDNSQSDFTDRERILAEGLNILSKHTENKEKELRLLRSLSSVGLVISSFAHEVASLRSRLIPRTTFLLKELKKHLNEENLAQLDIDDNPLYMIKLMQDEDVKLKHWLDYSLNTLKRDKRERTNLDFNDYFLRFKSTWGKALSQRKISLVLKGDENKAFIIKAFEVDMDSIFNNLLSNSLNALKGFSKEQKTITISWKMTEENYIEILFSDNGKGLDPKYHESPDEIFNLTESSKKDKNDNVVGTGLGLFIVKSIIEEYNSSNISIISITKGMQFKIIFKPKK